MNHPIPRIKQAAKRVFMQDYYRCIVATFVTGLLVSILFDYLLDGTLHLNNAFDFDALYSKLSEFKTTEEMLDYFRNSINTYISVVGYETYVFMRRKMILAMLISFVLRFIYRTVVIAPLQVGGCGFYMDAHSIAPPFKRLFCGFTTNYLNIVIISLLRTVYVFLWSLLLYIPGVIKTYETFMIPYILAEEPDIDYREAFRKSKAMMEGNKLNVFMLNLSFVGWMFLAVLTSGLAYVFFVGPYYDAALANAALRIRAEYNNKEI